MVIYVRPISSLAGEKGPRGQGVKGPSEKKTTIPVIPDKVHAVELDPGSRNDQNSVG